MLQTCFEVALTMISVGFILYQADRFFSFLEGEKNELFSPWLSQSNLFYGRYN